MPTYVRSDGTWVDVSGGSSSISGIGSTNQIIYKNASNVAIGSTNLTFDGTTLTASAFNGTVERFFENITLSATQLTGTINLDIATGSLFYYTANATGNWTFNIRGNSGTTLNSILPIGKSITITILSTQGASPTYATAFTIDGSSVTPKWINGTVPSSGYASSINIYTYVILKTANSTYTVIGSLIKFS